MDPILLSRFSHRAPMFLRAEDQLLAIHDTQYCDDSFGPEMIIGLISGDWAGLCKKPMILPRESSAL